MRSLLTVIFVLVYLAVLVMPAWVFFDIRGGTGFLSGLDTQQTALVLFPVFGLYALTLIWLQIILGSLLPLWQHLFPKLVYFHRAQGIFALLFALAHPVFRVIGFGPSEVMANLHIGVASEQAVWLLTGYVQLFLLILTVATALFMRTKMAGRWWRKLHYTNYLVFALSWFHSWYLGSDIQTTDLRYLWIGFGVTAIVAVILRLTIASRRSGVVRLTPHLDSGE